MSDINARDFLNIREQINEFMKKELGNRWTDTGEADELSVIADVIAHVTDSLHYYIDFQKKEATLATATHEKNVITLASGYGYRPRMMSASRGKVTIEFSEPLQEDLIIKKGTVFTTSNGLTRSDNYPVTVIKSHTVYAGVEALEVDVAQGEFINLRRNYVDIVPGGRVYLDSSFIAEGFTTMKVDSMVWTMVEDVYTEERVGRFFSIHIEIQNNLERYFIQLPYNYSTYISQNSLIEIEYLQTQGEKGILSVGKVDTMLEPLITTTDRDITELVTYLGNRETILGGAPRESVENIRINTVNYLRSLESLVTISDYQDFCSSFIGKTVSAVDWRTAPNLVKEPYKVMIIADLDETLKEELKVQIISRQARPDEVVIVNPIERVFDLDATIYLNYTNSGEDTVMSAVKDAISINLVDKVEYGKSIWVSNIYTCIESAHGDIQRVIINSPKTDIEVAGYEIPKLDKINLTFKVGR